LLAFSRPFSLVWVTYLLRPPVLKLSNVIAYLVFAAITTGLAYLFYRVLLGIFSRKGRKTDPAPRFLTVGMPVGLLVLTAAVLLLPTAYLQEPQSAQSAPTAPPMGATKDKRPNIVFILIDTLRADHLPMYGYSRQTAPTLTAIAQQGITFKRLDAQASWTKPSIATLFSSLYPKVHKVNKHRDFFTDSITTLPEVLHAAGYKTSGVSANIIVSPTFGYGQGFDELRVWKTLSAFRLTMIGRLAEDIFGQGRVGRLLGEQGEAAPRADVITDIALDWALQNGQQPFFLYVHYIDPHKPYRALPPYDQTFDYRRTPPIRAGGSDPLKLLPSGKDPDRVGRILDQYDGEILYTDFQVDRLLKGLEKLGFMDNAITAVTSDHGEEFFEHGQDGHGRSAYEEVLRVPFLLRWPGHLPAGVSYEGIAGLIDAMPTILSLVSIEPPTGLQGMNLAASLLKPESTTTTERQIFSETLSDRFSLESVSDGSGKLIRHPYGPQQGQEEFYDLDKDPLERTNLASQAPAQVALLKQELDTFNKLASQAAQDIESQQVQLDRDTERTLRSLGYLK
jgi:arylsulfatase A-like enzyme